MYTHLNDVICSGLHSDWCRKHILMDIVLWTHVHCTRCPARHFFCFSSVFGELSGARLYYITTRDAGQTWSGVTDLSYLPEIQNWATFAIGPGHGVQTKTGRLIVPLYAYMPSNPLYLSNGYAPTLYSDDQGKKWQFGNWMWNGRCVWWHRPQVHLLQCP